MAGAVDDEAYIAELRVALARALEDKHRLEQQVAATAARAHRQEELLVAHDLLKDGHRRLWDRVEHQARGAVRPGYRLRQFIEDKYELVGPEIDCVARLPICRARCCSLEFDLTPQDVAENRVRWEPDRPFMMRHEPDGMCPHLDRSDEKLGCTVYDHRPATCRTYSCAHDPRIWIDFDKRIPAPWPIGLTKPALHQPPPDPIGAPPDPDDV